jgi:four helix bundle protein
MSKAGFRELIVWKKSEELAVTIYKITNQGDLGKDFSLKDQMRRAAVSICSNIAEGDERDSDKESVRFLYIAKGSLGELSAQLEIAQDIGYINPDNNNRLQKDCLEIGKMLGGLIKARSKAK